MGLRRACLGQVSARWQTGGKQGPGRRVGSQGWQGRIQPAVTTSGAPRDFKPQENRDGWRGGRREKGVAQPCSKVRSVGYLRKKEGGQKGKSEVRFTLNSIKPPKAVGKEY